MRDIRLGTLVGTKTAGIASDPPPTTGRRRLPAGPPADGQLSAGHELINGIGVPPGYYLPLTAHDLSTGRDPDIAKALTLLGG